MKSIHILLLIPLLVCLSETLAQDDPCHATEVTDCASCLAVEGRQCAWCESLGITYHCNSRENYTNGWCANVTDPSSEASITQDEQLGSRASGQIYQVGPQAFDVSLRRGEPVNLTVTVHRTKNYPIDLYYLMDFSNSTYDDLQKLKSLAARLLGEMRLLTSNLQTGFGAFVDKPVWPYADPSQTNPCKKSTPCPSAFAFQNIIPLTSIDDDFKKALDASTTSGNVDSPEGLTDALLQVAVCRKEINWRQNALKLLVIATDEQFHAAGDGRLAGIYRPNDGKCHMSSSDPGGMYTDYLDQDYPSLSQIRTALRQNGISPIFAITSAFEKLYQRVQIELEPVISSLGTIKEDAENIVSLIQTGYENVASQVTLALDHPNIEHRVFIEKCPKPQELRCTGVNVSQDAVFKVEVRLKECTNEPFSFDIEATPFGVSKVSVKPLCQCDCANYPNATYCSHHGSLDCGQCKCEEGWLPPTCGEKCETGTQNCSASNGVLPCSGHGSCICNKCECNKDSKGRDAWFGQYCQCAKRPCDYGINQRQCGGPGKGSCDCNEMTCQCECSCEEGWKNIEEDLACDCSTNTDDCKPENYALTQLLCSGRGKCICGSCECDKVWDDGGQCEECSQAICPKLCSRGNITECVKCKIPGIGNLTKAECSSNVTCPYTINFMEGVPKENTDYYITIGNVSYATTQTCLFTDEDDCELKYFVAVTNFDELVDVHVIKKEYGVCPGSLGGVPIWLIVVAIIAGIVGIGLLLLLLWWLLARLHDYREFKAFEREQANAAWNQTTSPLYEPPNKEYKNPMYKKKKAA
eukprot:m.3091 g.3091  ORF g.3091 m.3091 type:complete len:808 (+) comp9048_c0_seq1:244-2667(+)